MSGTKIRVPFDKRVWINKALNKLGRKPKFVEQESGGSSGTNPAYIGPDEGSSSGTNRAYVGPEEGSSTGTRPRRNDGGSRRAAFEQLTGTNENIHRDRTLLGRRVGQSSDKGYEKNVETPVYELVSQLSGPLMGQDDLERKELQKVFQLRAALLKEQQGYGDRKTGEKKQAKAAQRDTKVSAIDERLEGLDKLMTPDLVAGGLMAPKGEGGIDTKEMVEATVELRGADEDYMARLMTTMATRQIENETSGRGGAAEAKKNLMRSNTALSELVSTYMTKTQEGQEFRQDYQDEILSLVRSAPPIEVDPFKVKPDPRKTSGAEQQKAAVAKDGARQLVALVNKVLDQTLDRELPAPIVALAGQVATEVRGKGLGDDDAAVAVGAIVMLRVINPAITELIANPAATPEMKRTLILVQKATQNLANHTDGSDKEPYMAPVMNAIGGRMDDMAEWLLKVADGG
jgi:hypothetical protein